MKLKSLIAFLLVLALFISGCSNHTDDNGPSIDSTTDTADGQFIQVQPDETDPVEDEEITTPAIPVEKYIWEKDFQDLDLKTVRLNAEWNEYIYVGGALVSAVNFTDISDVPNYFFYGQNNHASFLRTTYFVPTIGFTTETDQVDLGNYVLARLNIVSTSLATTAGYNAAIEEVRFTSTIHPYEGGGIDAFKARAPYVSDGNFGIGSNYKYVVSLLGEPTDSFTYTSNDGTNRTTCIYVDDNAELVLLFMWAPDDGIDSAALTLIDWTPSSICETLHTQPNIQDFEGYRDVIGNSGE